MLEYQLMYKGIKSEKFLPFQWHKSALKFENAFWAISETINKVWFYLTEILDHRIAMGKYGNQ